MVFGWLKGKKLSDGLLVEDCHKTEEGGIVCDFETKEGSHFKIQSLDGSPQSLKAIRKRKVTNPSHLEEYMKRGTSYTR